MRQTEKKQNKGLIKTTDQKKIVVLEKFSGLFGIFDRLEGADIKCIKVAGLRPEARAMWEEGAGGSSSSGGTSSAKHSELAKQEAIFNELMQECRHSAPGARLSAKMRTALERCVPSHTS